MNELDTRELGTNTVALAHEHLLLRGTTLRNTEYVYGIVVFTGHETKVMKNTASARMKFSKLQGLTS